MEEYLDYSVRELEQHARIPLMILKWDDDIFYSMAVAMASEIERNNALGWRTVLLCQTGPARQYRYFVELVNQRHIRLQNCWFIYMGEYLDEREEWISPNHPLSLRGFVEREVRQRLDPQLALPGEQCIFPDPRDPQAAARLLRELGGANVAFGGIGLDGSLAFNGPSDALSAERFAASPTRIVELTPLARVATALTRAGGAVECVPQKAVTLGMAELLSAKKMYIGLSQAWQRYAVRRTVCGDVSAQFPATLLQRHPNAQLVVSETAAQTFYNDVPEVQRVPLMELAAPRRKKRRALATIGGGVYGELKSS